MADFYAGSPLEVLALAPLLVMLCIALRRRHSLCLGLSLFVLLLTLALVFVAQEEAPRQLTGLFVIDTFGLFYVALTLIAGIVVLVLGPRYLSHKDSQPEEYYVLMLIAIAGGCAMALSTHFASFYLSLEVLSVAQYGLVAYVRRDRRGTEAGLKYIVLAAASAAFMLFGMALIYGELGSMQFDALVYARPDQTGNRLIFLGVAMLFAGVGFKLSLAPFHLWTADVYEGAPAPVTAFISTVSKFGVLAVLVRYFAFGNGAVFEALLGFVALTAALSMIIGSLLALVQQNIKRFLAFSSVAQMGYIFTSFVTGGELAATSTAFYVLAYAAATLGAFGVITVLSERTDRGHDIERLDDYRGLYWIHPALALMLAISLLSLAGIPLTAGFIGKFYVVWAGAMAQYWWLLGVLALSSTIGVYYYLRVIAALFTGPDTAAALVPAPVPLSRTLTLVGLAAATLVLGIYPSPVIELIHALSASPLP